MGYSSRLPGRPGAPALRLHPSDSGDFACSKAAKFAPVSETVEPRSTRRSTSPGAEEILGLYFPVLDHGFVSLVDYMGTDEDVERAARVSYGYGTRAQNKTRGLIRYLRRHKHTTPSEMVELKFH
jgi:thymidylate synthase (FAD)